MRSPRDERLSAYRQEMPYRPLWPVAHAMARSEPGVAFLDSSGPAENAGRWAVLGWRPTRTLRWPSGRSGAFEALARLLHARRLRPDPASPVPYRGGFLGWISYDIGRHAERLPQRLPVLEDTPDFVLAEYEVLLVEDRLERRLFLAGACPSSEGPSRLLARQSEALDLIRDAPEPAGSDGPACGAVRPDVDRTTFEARVERVLEYIRAGDIFQANVSQRFTATLDVPALEAYRRLRSESPAPYGCWMDLGGPQVLSISPELFLERRGNRVATRPIKGTRPRAVDADEDARLRAELGACAKERAELAMIVDLLRNDLGRTARTGSVRVEAERVLTAHPTVHHASATVTADVDDSVGAADLLRTTMPGGSITGAPKIRAMEILEELEDVRRGPYCGAAGWFGYDGDLTLNILIRTLCVRGRQASFHVGGGIVADSDPSREYAETLDKGRALSRALGREVT